MISGHISIGPGHQRVTHRFLASSSKYVTKKSCADRRRAPVGVASYLNVPIISCHPGDLIVIHAEGIAAALGQPGSEKGQHVFLPRDIVISKGGATTMRVFLIRHGETQWNTKGRLQGQRDSPVTGRGHQQIQTLCLALRDIPINHVFSSPLGRAAVAAQRLAAAFCCPLTFDERFSERSFGAFDGQLISKLQWRYSPLWQQISAGDLHLAPPGGETLDSARARVLSALRELPRYSIGNVCVVSHGHLIQAVIQSLHPDGGDDFRRYAPLNGSYAQLEVQDDMLSLVSWGQASHLLASGVL